MRMKKAARRRGKLENLQLKGTKEASSSTARENRGDGEPEGALKHSRWIEGQKTGERETTGGLLGDSNGTGPDSDWWVSRSRGLCPPHCGA